MSWAVLIVLAGIINAVVNYGYKILSDKDVMVLAACVWAIGAVVMLSIIAITRGGIQLQGLMTGSTPYVVAGMGVMFPVIMWLFLTAFAMGGPISLVDPLLACVYGLTSVVIGMILLKEAPSMTALAGVGLYLVGAFLMARG
ncbi:MAG: hypothetical protein WAZ18_05685 [Alphaproteobacteria bacterium]